jgi:hypothetical protein
MGLQKRAHRRLLAMPEPSRPAAVADAGWRLGLVFLAFGALGSLGNYSLLGQARASAMAGITVVSNALMAHFMLGEQLSAIDALVAALVIAGIATSVTFGAGATGSPPTATLDQLLAVLNRDATIEVVAPLTALLALACELGARALKRRREGEASVATTAAALDEADAGEGRRRAPRPTTEGLALRRLEAFLRALLCGCFSGLTGFCAKAVTCCVTSMVAERSADDLSRVEFWVLWVPLHFHARIISRVARVLCGHA